MIGGAFWRIRNHPVSEAIVAKSSLLTHGDVYSVSRIAELGNNIGVGFQHMLNWLETLSVPQQVYAWKLFAGTEAMQTFLNKFQGAEQLYGEDTAQRVLQRLKFVLLDGKIDIPSTLGLERLLGEAMEAYKAAFFTFAGELSDAISRTDIVMFEKKLQDNLPLLKEVLAGVLSLCVRLDDEVTKEHRTTLGRWILKLFRVDSAALLLSPLSPADQVIERKLIAGVGVDIHGDSAHVPITSSENDFAGTKQPGRPPAGDSGLASQQQSAQSMQQMQQQPEERMMLPQYSRSITFTGKAEEVPPYVAEQLPASTMGRPSTMISGPRGGDSMRPTSLLTIYGLAKVPAAHGAAVPSTETVGAHPGMTVTAKSALSTSDIPNQQATKGMRSRRPEETYFSAGRRDTSSMRQWANITLPKETMSRQGTPNVPGTDTLTSMAAILRAEAEISSNSMLGSERSKAAPTTYRPDPQQTYALDGYMLDGHPGGTVAARRTVSGGDTHMESIVIGKGRPLSAGSSRRETLDKASATTGGGASLGGGDDRTPAGYTVRYFTKLNESNARRVGGEAAPRARLVQQPGNNGESSTDTAKRVNALRAGLPLSATELKTRLRNMDKVMQTSNQQDSVDTTTEGTLRRRAGAAGQQTVTGTLDPNRDGGPLLRPAIRGRWGTAAPPAATARGTLPPSTVRRDQSLSTSTVHAKGTLPASALDKTVTPSTSAEHSNDEKLSTQASLAAEAETLKTFAADAAREALKTAKAAAERTKGASLPKGAARATQSMSKAAVEWGARGTSTSEGGRGISPSPKPAFGWGAVTTTSTGDAGRQPAVTSLRNAWTAREIIPTAAGRERTRETQTDSASASERKTLQTPATGAEQSTVQTPATADQPGKQRTPVVRDEGEQVSAYRESTDNGTLTTQQTLGRRGTLALMGAGAKLGAPSDSPAPGYEEILSSRAANGRSVATLADLAKHETINEPSPSKQKTQSPLVAWGGYVTVPAPADDKQKQVDSPVSAQQTTLSLLAADAGKGRVATPAGVAKQKTVAPSIGPAGGKLLEPSAERAEGKSPGAPTDHSGRERLAITANSAEARPLEEGKLPDTGRPQKTSASFATHGTSAKAVTKEKHSLASTTGVEAAMSASVREGTQAALNGPAAEDKVIPQQAAADALLSDKE